MPLASARPAPLTIANAASRASRNLSSTRPGLVTLVSQATAAPARTSARLQVRMLMIDVSALLFRWFVISGTSERHAQGQRVRRRPRHVFENGPHGGIETVVVARLRIENREPVVHPLPDVV